MIPPGRRKFCSAECARHVSHMARVGEDFGPSLRKRSTRIGMRTCLDCGKKFLSEGPWNRICPACGHKASHQQGGAPRRPEPGDIPIDPRNIPTEETDDEQA